MVGTEFCQWCRTICQLTLLGVGLFLFMGQTRQNRRPSHRFGGETMPKSVLSLEPGYIPVRIRRRVLHRDNYHCVWCGKPETRRVSHFIQKGAGGETSYYNLVTTCEACKRKRHYDTPSEFISKLKLQDLDVFREMGMVKLEIIKKNGKKIYGEVDSRPDPNSKGFWITYPGNGTQELIKMEEVASLKVLGGEEKK